MDHNVLYSIMLEIRAKHDGTIPATIGRQVHGLFHHLVQQFDPALSAQLHKPEYRPFTISSLHDIDAKGERIALHRGQSYRFRITLLDGGEIWRNLSQHFMESGPISVQLGSIHMQLTRMLSSSSANPTSWTGSTDWQTLVSLPTKRQIILRFASPTAFSLGNRQFDLFPKPYHVWESLRRTWNRYAPDHLTMDIQNMRQFLTENVAIVDCHLSTDTLHFPENVQKGFVGSCTYQIAGDNDYASRLTCLAAFAFYAGVGYKTTMGMGQVQASFVDASLK